MRMEAISGRRERAESSSRVIFSFALMTILCYLFRDALNPHSSTFIHDFARSYGLCALYSSRNSSRSTVPRNRVAASWRKGRRVEKSHGSSREARAWRKRRNEPRSGVRGNLPREFFGVFEDTGFEQRPGNRIPALLFPLHFGVIRMKRLLGVAARIFKFIVLGLLLVECASFLVISVSNYIIYGKIREGSKVHYDPYALFLNEEGQRPTSFNAFEPGARNVTIWMFGGSTMRGATDHDAMTIPSLLVQGLNAWGGEARYTAFNFGENSFNSLMETKYFQKIMVEKPDPKPNVIIFYDGANECVYFTQHGNYGHHGYRRVRALIESYHRSPFGLMKPLVAALYASFTKELHDKIMQVLVPVEKDSEVLRLFVDQAEQRYDYMDAQARALNAAFVLVWQPVLWVETGEVASRVREAEQKHFINSEKFKTMRHNFALVYGALAERLRNKPYFVDFRNVLCERAEPSYQADGVHLTDSGRRGVAEAMRSVIEGRLNR